MKEGRRGNMQTSAIWWLGWARNIQFGGLDGPETYKYNTDLNGPEASKSKWARNIQI